MWLTCYSYLISLHSLNCPFFVVLSLAGCGKLEFITSIPCIGMQDCIKVCICDMVGYG